MRLSMQAARFIRIYARLALAASFLDSVADRFGLWGPAGTPGVSWGNWARFVGYTAQLNFFLPRGIVPVLAVFVTAAELSLGVLLIAGVWRRAVGLLSGMLIGVFALAMAAALGVKAPMDYSVFSASAAALLLAVCPANDGTLQSEEAAKPEKSAGD